MVRKGSAFHLPHKGASEKRRTSPRPKNVPRHVFFTAFPDPLTRYIPLRQQGRRFATYYERRKARIQKEKGTRKGTFFFLVREAGLEPARP